MSGDDSKLLKRMYAEALQRDPEERAEYLQEAYPDRADLHPRVIAALTQSDEFLDGAAAAEPDGRTTFAGARVGSTPTPQASGAGGGGRGPGKRVGISGEDDDPLRRIGDYVIRRELGRGGMGIVYLADDTRLQRRVALKALNPDLNQRPDLRERLRNEARVAGGLSHPGIATIYALEEIDGELYMACEFVPGTPLRSLVKSGPVSIDEVLSIGLQLGHALAEAHTLGIVHRDLKPENVMRTPSGAVKILDFGLARDEHAPDQRLTNTGFIVGTPAYLAPEQLRGQQADFRTDLFAFGLLLYELASGINPFVDKTVTGTMARIIEYDPPPLSSVQPRNVSGLDQVIEICLHKEPQERYGSTRALITDLERVQAEIAQSRTTPVGVRHVPSTDLSSSPAVRWLAVHQLVVSLVYIGTLYPAWYAKGWLPDPWGLMFVLAILGTAAAATALRLHLWFTAERFPDRLAEQHARSSLGGRICDLLFAAALIAAAFGIGQRHPEFAMLFVGIATALVVVSFVIEPATAAAATAAPDKLRRG